MTFCFNMEDEYDRIERETSNKASILCRGGVVPLNIVSVENISKSYSEKTLLKDISFGIEEGDKISLIGINGIGKSTLLKIAAGAEVPDGGRVIRRNNLQVEYLPQNPEFQQGISVLQQVFRGHSPVMKLLRDYEYTLKRFNEGDNSQEKRLIALTNSMDSMHAWELENEAKTILSRLGILDFDMDIGTLSGGQKKRVALASALINPADLLILDEPTNHIDTDTVDWLEKYLNGRKGALLMVTHDRYFLDRVCNRIIELDHGVLYSYRENYSKYLSLRLERQQLDQTLDQKRESLLKRELDWIRQGAKARTTKQKARIDRFEQLQDQETRPMAAAIEIDSKASRLGRKTIILEHVHKSFDGREFIKDFNYILQRRDRVGIIGPNGIGKTTLLRMIGGTLAPDQGEVITGETVKVGFFTQECDEIDEINQEVRVIDYIRSYGEVVATNEGVASASQMLEKFLFPPAVQWTPVAKLSGGERRRLYLLRILLSSPNILMMDEPTNDLDIQTLTILESYLDDFPGAVIIVSHDRYFLDRVVNRILSFNEAGVVNQYEGNYSDYLENIRLLEDEEDVAKTGKNEKTLKQNAKDKPLKFSYKEQKEYEEIDPLIAHLEQEIHNVTQSLDEDLSDYEYLQRQISKKELLEAKLHETMDRWVYLNELAENIAKEEKE